MIWITSDLHLQHDKSFIYEARGFNSIQEHDEAIIKNWNKLVEDYDVVYILGDLIMGESEQGIELLRQLNGSLRVILGNHCAHYISIDLDLNNKNLILDFYSL